MIDRPIRDRRAERRESTRGEILDAAWELARQHGLAGLSLRDVAAKVGMRPPSLYWYFDAKNAVYDAMFAAGNRQLLERLAAEEWPGEPRALLGALARVFMQFSAEDPARSQLLFQRAVPDFAPSPASYQLAVAVLDRGHELLATVGVTDPAHLDLFTAVVSGLAAQQLANEPGGDRWLRLIGPAVEMYADYVLTQRPAGRRR